MEKAKRQFFFRTATLFMAIAICMGAFAACGSQPSQSSAASSRASSSPASSAPAAEPAVDGYKLPIVTEPTTLTIMCRENSSATAPTMASGNLVVWNKIQELTGVAINWECTISADYEKTLQTRMASGSDLPDMLTIPDPVPYMRQKMLIPIDHLVARYAPDIQRVFEENKDVKASMLAPDGAMYCVPTIPKFVNEIHTRAPFIRKDWLDKVGKDVPTTMDEWYDVLKAFKENDLDGDGNADNEVPYAHGSKTNLSDQRVFSAAYGLELAYANGYNVKDDKVFYDFTTENAKAFITMMNKFYAEGLMAIMENSAAKSGLATNLVGSCDDFPDAVTTQNKLLTTEHPDAVLVPAPFPKTEYCEGRSVAPYPVYDYNASLFITTNCKQPEVAVQWLNFCYTDEGTRLLNVGIEGEHYTLENGRIVLGDWYLNNPNGLGPSDAQRELGARPNVPFIMSREFEEQVKATCPVVSLSVPLIAAVSRSPSFPSVMALEEEMNVLKNAGADFKTFVDENVAKFILGERPMSEYDNFVAEMDGMGLQDILAVKQSQYDRYMEAINS